MMRTHMLTLATMACVVACSDAPNAGPTGPAELTAPSAPLPSAVTIAGRISVRGEGVDRVIELRDADGQVYRLLGNETGALASVDGGDVEARGTFDANPGFVVDEFTVTAMHGRPALDGVLESTDEGFALRLSDGSLRAVPLGADCSQHVGARIWVTGWADAEVEFGVIAAI